jgi:hypothetical protein
MKTSKETQTTLTSDLDQSFNLSTSGRMVAREESQPKETFIDPENTKHISRLLEWCKVHWTATFKRSLEACNCLYYHGCCNSFSRRRFTKVAGHPSIQSCSILKIPSFKEVDSADDLYRWLLKMITANTSKGQRMPFPSINKYHVEEVSDDEENRHREDHSPALNKRFQSVQAELDKYKSQLQDLQRDNSRLLCSSKNWRQKYYDLLDQQERQTQSAFQTPMKHNITKNFEFFSNQNYYLPPSASILLGVCLGVEALEPISFGGL